MATFENLVALQTEQRNAKSTDIDQIPTIELCQIINREDSTIAGAVSRCIPVIAAAIDCLAERVQAGGRVIYTGAGTSGRLGVLDASEIPPTYSAPEGQFVGIIAGGDAALRNAQEGAEDDSNAAVRDLEALQLNGAVDSLIGIAASGRTPYVLSGLSYAKSLGCATIGVACAQPSAMSTSGVVDFMIDAVVGPEVITGSTRMKAGTATKLALNMLSTGTMIKIGKTYGNMMVDLKATNFKLQQRSRNILRTICGSRCPDSDASLDALLESCQGSVKLAIATLGLGTPVAEAKQRLEEASGVLANVLKKPTNGCSNGQTTADGDAPDYVLCVDGGGSKCAAVVISADGQRGYGEGPGCNVTDVGVESAVLSISLAIQRAWDRHPTVRTRPWTSDRFSSIWIALAGHDRKEIAATVDSVLEKLFKRPVGVKLRVTNDIELLATAAAEKNDTSSAIVLVAGTGSIAMTFERQGDRFIRIGRSGGWGHLLGDDGSGFDIGRQALRLALSAVDEFNNQRRSLDADSLFMPTPLVSRILDSVGPNGIGTLDLDLLSAVLSPASDVEKKKQIAQVARVVIDSSTDDAQARNIVEKATKNLVQLLDRLTRSGQIDVAKSSLVLAGGLMQSNVFADAFNEALHAVAFDFKHVEVVNQPAVMGAEYLLRMQRG
ncbi:N-acetylmuramic acid 6-phosphate etherase [Cladophialophora bantiana CBS 173.52]|uniref:N-acetyl-D-glucosamine kinase n=1 Tax=Cladophialophora bantiana (strain ATCC 10958 / CBS 173.52 / CDC B-1940 / NIH 8579) TaxID=1442370 RepID=A0A0D2GFG4_CLAB1|nr:N-acetylmuramic acid 6-phosphate etherase [Cladophialophora bantiana CBS 173.52]KIW97102.1 N-acetylmuramic acid 6-phosphate etherase [Cladophialophora bantiana CBS 173.52]